MSRVLRTRFRVEVGIFVAAITLLTATLVWPEWIEIVFHVDPDAGSGSLEWLIVVGCAAASLLLAILSSTEWRRSPRRDEHGAARA